VLRKTRRAARAADRSLQCGVVKAMERREKRHRVIIKAKARCSVAYRA